MTGDPWAGILARDEYILWQGKPHQPFYWRKEYSYGGIAAFVALFLILAGDANGSVKLLMVFVGLPLFVFAAPVFDGIRRHYSFFTLTNRRGIVGLDMPVFGRRLRSHYFTGLSDLSVDHSESASAVYFRKATRQGRYGKQVIRIGFEGVTPDEAEEVHRLIRETLKGTS